MSTKSFYYDYLDSRLWNRNKNKAAEIWGWSCVYCGKDNNGFHHFQGYDDIWTPEDYNNIIPVCSTHHYLSHFTITGKKIPLTKTSLLKRHRQLKRQYWRRIKPSDVFSFIGRLMVWLDGH